MRHKQPRVIVRPWIPRQIPYQVRKTALESTLKQAYPQLEKIAYVGWVKRKVKDKRVLYFILATGNSPTEARTRFKISETYGDKIWIIE